jgi:hypothetical protein
MSKEEATDVKEFGILDQWGYFWTCEMRFVEGFRGSQGSDQRSMAIQTAVMSI